MVEILETFTDGEIDLVTVGLSVGDFVRIDIGKLLMGALVSFFILGALLCKGASSKVGTLLCGASVGLELILDAVGDCVCTTVGNPPIGG